MACRYNQIFCILLIVVVIFGETFGCKYIQNADRLVLNIIDEISFKTMIVYEFSWIELNYWIIFTSFLVECNGPNDECMTECVEPKREQWYKKCESTAEGASALCCTTDRILPRPEPPTSGNIVIPNIYER